MLNWQDTTKTTFRLKNLQSVGQRGNGEGRRGDKVLVLEISESKPGIHKGGMK